MVAVTPTSFPGLTLLTNQGEKAAMAEVAISETVLVLVPATSPSSEHGGDQQHILPLSHIDTDSNLHVTFRTLRAYACSNNHNHDDPFDVITQALSKTLRRYYPVAGTLQRRSSDGRLELLCSAGQGVPVTRAKCSSTLASLNYLDEPGAPFLDRLVPDPGSGEELDHPLAMQITRFACGGFSLGICFYHSMCDGAGATQFLSAVAEIVRGGGADISVVEPVWDRAVLLGPREPPRVEVDFSKILMVARNGELPEPCGRVGEYEVARESFHVSNACLELFRVQLAAESGSNFTTFEALGAFIWRARVKASKVPYNEKVKLAYSMNIRKILNPPLPACYWGNVCVPVYVQLTAKDLVEKPMWETAMQIKKSKHGVTDEYVRSFIDFQELHYSEGITAGEGVSGFTDWRHLGHSAVDFGWGGPVTVLPLSFKLLGSAEPSFFLPYASVNGTEKEDGFKALVSLPATVMPDFRSEMEIFKG